MTTSIGSASIESLCLNVTSGGTPSRRNEEFWANGTIPWVKTGELKDCYIYDAEEKITEAGLMGSSAKVFPINTVLMAMYGDGKTITSLAIVKNEVATNQACCAMITDPAKCDYRYLYYALMHHRHRLLSLVVAGAQRNLSNGIIKRFKISTFPLKTQQKIASILSAYDDLIENNRRRIQLLEQAARLLYREWFVYLRFPGHEHISITDGVPEGWEKKTVLEVIEIKPKEAVPKGTPIRYVPMTCLSTTGMTVDLSDVEVRTKSTSVRYRNGDILFARITPCLENGKTGFVNFLREDEVACGSTEFIVLRGSSVSPYFAYCLARTHDFRETAIKSMIGSSGRQRVQPSCFDDFIVARPPRFLRDEFDRICEPIFSQIAELSSQVQSLTQARDLLLPRLMNGEVAV